MGSDANVPSSQKAHDASVSTHLPEPQAVSVTTNPEEHRDTAF